MVEKHREIFLYHTVRIHLDDVVGLGHFLELEAVLGGQVDEPAARAMIDSLQRHFALSAADLLASPTATWYDGKVFLRAVPRSQTAERPPAQSEFILIAALRRNLCVLTMFAWATAALAGGGPEGMLLVVNPQSATRWRSPTITPIRARFRPRT